MTSFAAVALAACVAAPPAMQNAPLTSPPAAAAPSRAVQVLSAAGGANAPTRDDVERAFGSPDIVRQDGAGAALTYRLETCALLLLFEADTQNVHRLTEAHTSARRAGEAAPSLDQCAAEARR